MSNLSIVSVGANNVEDLGFFCVKNKKYVGYIAKLLGCMTGLKKTCGSSSSLPRRGSRLVFWSTSPENIPGGSSMPQTIW